MKINFLSCNERLQCIKTSLLSLATTVKEFVNAKAVMSATVREVAESVEVPELQQLLERDERLK